MKWRRQTVYDRHKTVQLCIRAFQGDEHNTEWSKTSSQVSILGLVVTFGGSAIPVFSRPLSLAARRGSVQ